MLNGADGKIMLTSGDEVLGDHGCPIFSFFVLFLTTFQGRYVQTPHFGRLLLENCWRLDRCGIAKPISESPNSKPKAYPKSPIFLSHFSLSTCTQAQAHLQPCFRVVRLGAPTAGDWTWSCPQGATESGAIATGDWIATQNHHPSSPPRPSSVTALAHRPSPPHLLAATATR